MAKKNNDRDELRVSGVPKHRMDALKNISDHMGVTRTQLVKQNLHVIINQFPPYMTEPFDENDIS